MNLAKPPTYLKEALKEELESDRTTPPVPHTVLDTRSASYNQQR